MRSLLARPPVPAPHRTAMSACPALWLQADLNKHQDEIHGLKKHSGTQAAKLDDAAQMLKDKDTLEEAVRKQHDLIGA